MPDNSAILALPYIQPSQAQKHVTHNEALAILDVLVQLSVAGFDATTPPVDPIEGETHALGAGPSSTPTGVWAGQDNALATWRDGTWVFFTPLAGWRAWGVTEAALRIWDGAAWVLPPAGTDNLAGVGINTTADATNRLSVSADATLLSHDGAGHQLKINKASDTDTASFLFQTGFSGRAEIGLTGSDDFTFKVSADGSSWISPLVLDTNGDVTFDSGTLFVDTSATRVTVSGRLSVDNSNDVRSLLVSSTHASLTTDVLRLKADRAATSSYNLLRAYSGGTSDLEFQLSGDGNGTCDGAWTGGGADYGEYFEWADGNPAGEDRRGMSVVLVGDKIRVAKRGEDPIGVISGNPSVVGDAAPFRWKGKYLRDDFGSPVMEDYQAVSWVETVTQTDDGGREVSRKVDRSHPVDQISEGQMREGIKIPKEAARVTQTRRKLNPDHDPASAYIPRAARLEWDIVGLLGKLRIRKGQVIGAGWVRMRDVSDKVEEWLVR